MGKSVLSPAEFSRLVATRIQQERPDARVQRLGQSFLMLREDGRRRLLPLAAYYRRYSRTPERCEALIAAFLRKMVDGEGQVRPALAEVRERVLPQMLPVSLVEQAVHDGRELVAVPHVGDLAIGFVIDEEDRYTYIHRRLMERWGLKETDLLAMAVWNLQQLSRDVAPPLRIGRGQRLMLVWEEFDGYDASRILLTRSLCEMAAYVQGNPVIAVPHRDYMVMFGDSDADFLDEMRERIREEALNHRYRVSERLYTLHNGMLVSYESMVRRERVVN